MLPMLSLLQTVASRFRRPRAATYTANGPRREARAYALPRQLHRQPRRALVHVLTAFAVLLAQVLALLPAAPMVASVSAAPPHAPAAAPAAAPRSAPAAQAPSGTVWAFGNNWEGQIGNGSTGNSAPPTQVSGVSDVVDLSAAPFHSLALKGDGTIWGWGDNDSGQLGDGTTTRRLTPVQASGLSSVSHLAHTGYHSVVRKSDGTVWTWGRNEVGQLGHPSSSTCTWDDRNGPHTGPCSLTPGQVVGPGGTGTLTTIADRPGSIASGALHTLAVKTDGTVWAWGDDSFDQLGADPTETCTHQNGQAWPCSRTPIQVKGPGGQGFLTDIVMVAAGYFHSLALKSDGTVYAWGGNLFGQSGSGSAGGNLFYPTQVVGPGGSGVLTGIRVIAVGRGHSVDAGSTHSLALKNDGTVYAWGRNDVGQLGAPAPHTCTDNNITYPCAKWPIHVQGITDIVHVSAGRYHSLAVQRDGTPWGWGRNEWGMLAHTSPETCTLDNSTFPCSKTPHQMTDLLTAAGTVSLLSGGQDHTLALAGVPPGLPQEVVPPGTPENPPLLNQRASRFGVHTFTGHLILGGPPGAGAVGAVAGRGPLPFLDLAYNSNDTVDGPLGPGWTHRYRMRVVTEPGDTSGTLVLVGPQGRRDRYTKQPDGTYLPPADVRITLAKTAGGYTAAHPNETVWEFNAQGRLVAIVDRFGQRSSVTSSGDRVASVSDPAGRGQLSFTYDTCGAGKLCKVADWSTSPLRETTFAYDTSGRLQTITVPGGDVWTYAYDGSSARITTVTDPRGVTVLTTTWNTTTGKVAVQQDAGGASTSYSYDTTTRQTITTLPATSYEPGFQPRIIDTYTAEGWLDTQQREPEQNTAAHQTVDFTFDADGNVKTTTTPKGDVTTFCYDVNYVGQPLATTGSDPAHRERLTRLIQPAPSATEAPLVTLYQYNAHNQLVETIPPKGVNNGTGVTCQTDLSTAIDTTYATTMSYDAEERLTQVTRRFNDPELGAQEARTTYFYDDPANPTLPTKAILPRGNAPGAVPDDYATTTTYYPPNDTMAGLAKSVTDPAGSTTTFEYDAGGRRTKRVDPLGNASGANAADHTWTWKYDGRGRVTHETTPPPTAGGATLVTEYTYDDDSGIRWRRAASGQLTKYVLSQERLLAEVHESPDLWTDMTATPTHLNVTAYTYDNLFNLTRVTRAQGTADERVTDYTFDGNSRVHTETQYPNWPDTTSTLVRTTTYDRNGNQETFTDPQGQVTTFAYNALDWLTGIDYSDAGTADVSYTYDRHGNRTSMSDGLGTTSYEHDALDRPIRITQPVAGGKTVEYRYDLDSHRRKLIYPDATAVDYTFDAAGRLTGISDWAGRSTSYEYTVDHLASHTTHVNANTTDYSYDNVRRLTEIWHQHGEPASGSATGTPYSSGGYTTNASVAPSSVPQGQSTTITLDVTSDAASTVLVDLEVYSPSEVKVHQQVWGSQTFAAGETKPYQSTWSVPADAETGMYTVKIGIFAPDWSVLYHWNDTAVQCTVTTAGATISKHSYTLDALGNRTRFDEEQPTLAADAGQSATLFAVAVAEPLSYAAVRLQSANTTPTPTPTPTPVASSGTATAVVATVVGVLSPTPTPTPLALSPSPSPTREAGNTPLPTPTATPAAATGAATASPTPSVATTPTRTATVTATPTATATRTATATATATSSPTATATATATGTPAAVTAQTLEGQRVALEDVSTSARYQALYKADIGSYRLRFFDESDLTALVDLSHPLSGASFRFALPRPAALRTAHTTQSERLATLVPEPARAALPPAQQVAVTLQEGQAQAQVDDLTVRWTTTTEGLKEEVVLSAPPASNELTFAVSMQRLSIAPDGQGGYWLMDVFGKARFHVLPPTVADAQGNTGEVWLELSTDTLIVSLDPAFLQTAVYPITLDPSVTWSTYTAPTTLAYDQYAPISQLLLVEGDPNDPDHGRSDYQYDLARNRIRREQGSMRGTSALSA